VGAAEIVSNISYKKNWARQLASEKGEPTMAARTIPARRKLQRHDEASLFGPPPLFEGEDAAAYDALQERFTAGIRPEDVFEAM
jgi:hypothetical protein